MTEAHHFSSADTGTPEDVWRLGIPAGEDIPALELGGRAVVVVAAHPDDETLGCGGVMAQAAAQGLPVTVVLISRGEASHPDSPTIDPHEMAKRREIEARNALRLLGSTQVPIELVSLGFPDGDLATHRNDIVTALVATIGSQSRPCLILAPWRLDGHPDHEIAGSCAAAAAARTDTELAEYPIWFWHWGSPEALPTDRLRAHHLTRADRLIKNAAIDAHESQVRPLSDDAADAAVLQQHVLEHFDRDLELYVWDPKPLDSKTFDDLHRDDSDPWRVESPYEVQKRRATVAIFEDVRVPLKALEIGCSIGALTVDLAEVCGSVDALDSSSVAIDLARRRTAALNNVRLINGVAPDDIPLGPYDLVVLSEVGYFLSPDVLQLTIGALRTRLAPSALVVACHWNHPIRGWVVDGADVHTAITAAFGLPLRTVSHADYELALWLVE